MPKALSTPLILKAISKKEEAESIPTLKPKILTTQDYINIIDQSQKKHVDRVRDARQKKIETSQRELPDLSESMYKKIYASRAEFETENVNLNEKNREETNYLPFQEQRLKGDQNNMHPKFQDLSSEIIHSKSVSNPIIDNPIHSESQISRNKENKVNKAINKENIPLADQHSNPIPNPNPSSAPKTPIPRKQPPVREIKNNIETVSIVKAQSHTSNDSTTSRINQQNREEIKNNNQKRPSFTNNNSNILKAEKQSKLSLSGELSSQKKLNASKGERTTFVNSAKNMSQENREPDMNLDKDEILENEYLKVMQSLEQEEVTRNRPNISQIDYTRNQSNENNDLNSEKSDTPSLTKMYSHIESMTKYLDSLSDPDGLSTNDNQSETNHASENQFKTPKKKKSYIVDSPDAQPRTNVPTISAITSQQSHPVNIEKHEHKKTNTSLDNGIEEDVLSTPSPNNLGNEIKSDKIKRFKPRLHHQHIESEFIQQFDEKVQVPTPIHSAPFITYYEIEDVDPQTLLECEAPQSLEELNFDLDMPTLNNLKNQISDHGLSGLDMSTMSLIDVRNHIFNVCDSLNSKFYVSLEEKKENQPFETLIGGALSNIQYTTNPPFASYTTYAPNVSMIQSPLNIQSSLTIPSPSTSLSLRKPWKLYKKPHKFKEHFKLWYLHEKNCNSLRAKMINEIWTIQQKLIEEFFEKNSSLFQKVETLREQIRKEQSMIVSVQLRTTKSQELRLKKIRESSDKPPIIKATIRSSQSSYNLNMWEDEASRLIAKIFIRFLRFLVKLKREREHGLLIIEKEISQISLRYIFNLWKTYIAQYQEENYHIREMEKIHKTHLLRDSFQHWKNIFNRKMLQYEQQETADSFARKNILRKVFNSIQFKLVQNEINSMEEDIALRWYLSNRLVTTFSAWRQLAQRGQVLKQKLLNFAYSKSSDNEIIDKKLLNQHMALKLKIKQQLLQDFAPQYKKLRASYEQLLNSNRFILSSDTIIDKSIEYTENFENLENNKRVEEKSISLDLYSSLNEIKTHTEQANNYNSHFSSAMNQFQNISDKSSSVFSIESSSLIDIADRSYNIKLLRSIIYHWKFILHRLNMLKNANQFREKKLKEKSVFIWNQKTIQLHNSENKLKEFVNQRIVKKFFMKWKKDTNQFVELKDNIAHQCYKHHLCKRIFEAWYKHTMNMKITKEKELLFTNKRALLLLKKSFNHWRISVKEKIIHQEMDSIADKHYHYLLISDVIQIWKQKVKHRQLLRRVFKQALKSYRLEEEDSSDNLKTSLLRKYFGAWRNRAKLGAKKKNLKLLWKKAKQFHENKLKKRILSKLNYEHKKYLKADALYFNFLLQRTKRIFGQWRTYTSIKKQQRKAKEKENELIYHISNALLLRRVFKRWKQVVLNSKSAQDRPYIVGNSPTIVPAGPLKIKEYHDQAETASYHSYHSNTSHSSPNSQYSSNNSNMLTDKELQEYRKVQEEMKIYKQKRLKEMSNAYSREMSVAQIFYLKKLKLKMWNSWKNIIEHKREKQIIQERVDHFYNSKLQKMRFGRSIISLDRLENNIDHLPNYFQPTYRIVNYRLLLKALQDWKQYTRERKTQKIGLAIAARFNRRKILENSISQWRKKLELLPPNRITLSSAPSSQFSVTIGNYSKTTENLESNFSLPTKQSDSKSTVRFSDDLNRFHSKENAMYRPAPIAVSVTSSNYSLDKNQYGKPRKPFELLNIQPGGIYTSP